MCLTNIRCAVVEGSHRCEAACCTLQGYQLAAPIPLNHANIPIPPTSTLFKLTSTHVYNYKQKDLPLDENVLAYLQRLSETIAEQKLIVLKERWHSFFKKICSEITSDAVLMNSLYNTQQEFYESERTYKDFNNEEDQLYHVKEQLDTILTHAIFNYRPCKELLEVFKINTPTEEQWKKASTTKWLSFASRPYQNVSNHQSFFFKTVYLTLLIF